MANQGATDVPLAGWSVQYLPGSPTATSAWQVTPLDGAVAANGSFLVQEAAGAGGTTPLPSPDVTGSIAMSATTGTIALVNSTTQLTCKTAAACALDVSIVDLVGYGSAVVRETAPVPGASNTASVARIGSDTDNNAADFLAGAPTPTSGGGGPVPVVARIHEIQGTTHLSPFDGEQVSGVTGVVTAVRAFGSARGFWFQDTQPDADPATSEGLFVFTGSTTPAVAVGDAVTVAGTVDEFYADAPPASSVMLSTTELVGASWTVTAQGVGVPAEAVGATTVPEVYTKEPGGSIEELPLEPSAYALDFWESREGMRVRVDDVRVVGPTTPFNELFVTTKPAQNPTPRGGTIYTGYDQQNSGRVQVLSLIPFAQRPFPQADVGDVLAGETSGPVDYSRFGGYLIQATTLGAHIDNGLARESTRPQRPAELAVATYNVENLSPGNPQAKFDRLAAAVVADLASPDVLALEEIQDNSGPSNDGVVAADETLRRFTDAIAAQGGPRYDWRQIDPVDGADGGQPGGNIRVAFLFNPARVSFVDRPGGDATTPVEVLDGPRLSVSPGRIDPANAAWESSRKPLVGEFVFRGRTVFVVANHFASKGGDQPLFGRFQPPARTSEVQRLAQAAAVNAFAHELLAEDPRANLLVLGDINDFQFSPVMARLTQGGVLDPLINHLPVNERYGYVFQGNSQALDHILTSPFILRPDYDIVHINAEFADQASDHDPQVVRFVPTG
ncbi:endonuclease/exonuclease/phosphatase family protein [Actinokineospora soli]|uniref:Endonuclease/exonuclease/phosphatase family protein n=1 Tax=Actinokineospora soli TaxID=1048753 RepID=A0ABW2TYR0_9PSEU